MFLGQSATKNLQLGRKAQRLHELAELGFPVPPGFVVTQQERRDGPELAQALAKLGSGPVAVRSSSGLEDLGEASFAGMYETFLNVEGVEAVGRAIADCFASATSPRVAQYARDKGIDVGALASAISVLVQRMVPARQAGVLFGLDPVTGREEEVYLEVVAGLGEDLVSGHVTPSRYRYNWRSKKIVLAETHGAAALEPSQLEALVELALRLQVHYGQPQDLEWAFDESGKLWLLQARPVTSVAWRRDVPELTNADFKDGGVSARACPFLIYSLYERAVQASMSSYFDRLGLVRANPSLRWIYHLYGRAYWNAELVKRALAKLPGFDEADFDRGLGITKNYQDSKIRPASLNPLSVLTALRALGGLWAEYRDSQNMAREFLRYFERRDRALRRRCEALARLSDEELKALAGAVGELQFQTESRYFRVIYNNTNYQSDFRKALAKAAPDADYLKLVSGLEGMAHLEIEEDLTALAAHLETGGRVGDERYQQLRAQFLERHYHHADVELDLSVPRWGELPQKVDELVANFSPAKMVSHEAWKREWERVTTAHPRAARLAAELAQARTFLVLRERMRTLSTRAYYLVRKVALEVARRKGVREQDVHLWRWHEIERLTAPSAEELAERRCLVAGFRAFPSPNEFGGAIEARKDHSGLLGIGCSSGVVVGSVRVLRSLAEAQEFQSGEILVTVYTDPGWTPVLARAGGVITEVGGVLSHAAVIGREYGIPAVLNLAGATIKLKTGDRVRVDGRSGEVEKLS